MGIGRKATDQRTPCRKFVATPLVTTTGVLFRMTILEEMLGHRTQTCKKMNCLLVK